MCFPDLSKVTQKRIDLFPDSYPVMFLWPLKSHYGFAFLLWQPHNALDNLVILKQKFYDNLYCHQLEWIHEETKYQRGNATS